MLRRNPKFRDEQINKSDYMIPLLISQYEQLKRRQEDKTQELNRNRKLVEMMINEEGKQPTQLPALSKNDEFLFERIEILMMHRKPVFRVYPTAEKRSIQQYEEPRCRVILEKLCQCCGNLVKKHVCPHSKCTKPCRIEEKKHRQKVRPDDIQRPNGNNPSPDTEI